MDHRNSTPRPRPSLKFANRNYQASPLNPNKRLGTPQTAPSQRVLNRDPVPSSNLNTSTISTAHNLFRSSSISASPAVTPFAPSLPASTTKRVFAPGATPASQKVYRETIAQATPRGMSAKSTSADLFQMRIPSPPPELSGEALARDIPAELEAKGTVYADQYLGHLVPPEYDDLQRRQLFCVLDLRRLKYAANEIFTKKDWKLNIMNFAKEFEKSRSLIMLRYGLYEFKNVKPSEEVLKKWRTAHNLPEPEEDAAADASPSRQTTRSKRKAEEQLTPKDAALSAASPNKNNKRRAVDREEEQEPATPAATKNKRTATVTDESDENQASKLQKSTSTPSATKSLFEKVANNQGPSSTPKAAPKTAEAKPNPFAGASKATANNNKLSRSVFEANLKPAQASNIFGYLSDASSAKNSGVEADGESETDSDDEAETQETGQQSYEPSVAASGGAETPLAQPASNLFGAKKPLFSSGAATGPSSASSDARESTPGKSLFDRVSKGNNGQPLRADSAEPTPAAEKTPFAPSKESAAAPVNATWNPNSPIKFNANAPTSNGPFGASTNGSSSLFGAKPAAPASNLFGAPKQDEKPKAEKRSRSDDDAGAESDKENSSQPPAKSPFGGFASSGFQPKPSEEPKKDEAASKPAATPAFAFGAPAPKAEEAKPSAPASNLFGSQEKPTGSVIQSSTLFGSKPQGTATAEPAKPLFGASTSGTPSPFQSNPLFGNSAPASGTSNLFGAKPAEKAPETAPAAAPVFSFGASKPAESAPAASSPFGGNPMQHDGPPAKKQFNAPSPAPPAPSGGMFNFGGQSTAPSNPFGAAGAAPAPQANGGSSGPPSFGSGGGGSFTFSAGGGGQSFNNPFASNNGGASDPAPASSSGGMFNFGGGSSAPTNGSSPFQFGGGSSAAAPSSNTAFQFGAGAPAQPAASAAPTPTFAFGATNGSANASAPASQKPLFGASTSAPTSNLFGSKPAQPASGMFGNLQPPAGASTTGTNSPFNFGGASSLATTPATGTPEPAAEPEKAAAGGGEGDDADGKPHEQLKLTEGGPGEEDEAIVHDVRAKILKFIPAGSEEDKDSGDDQPKNKSPWTTKGVGPFRLLKHKNTGAVRMLLRAEPRGHVVLNRSVLPGETYKADKKYVKLTTSNESGTGLETWMVQVKTEDLAKTLASALESHKLANAK